MRFGIELNWDDKKSYCFAFSSLKDKEAWLKTIRSKKGHPQSFPEYIDEIKSVDNNVLDDSSNILIPAVLDAVPENLSSSETHLEPKPIEGNL